MNVGTIDIRSLNVPFRGILTRLEKKAFGWKYEDIDVDTQYEYTEYSVSSYGDVHSEDHYKTTVTLYLQRPQCFVRSYYFIVLELLYNILAFLRRWLTIPAFLIGVFSSGIVESETFATYIGVALFFMLIGPPLLSIIALIHSAGFHYRKRTDNVLAAAGYQPFYGGHK